MREDYVRPPLLAREQPPAALAGLPFRLLLLALLAGLVWLIVVVVAPLLNSEAQAPGTISLPRSAAPAL